MLIKRKLNNLLNKNDEGVSTVISTVLMVAIALTLLTVLGSYTFSQDAPERTPQAVLDVKGLYDDWNNVYIKIEHNGGDPLSKSNTKVIYNGSEVNYIKFPEDNNFDVGESVYLIKIDNTNILIPFDSGEINSFPKSPATTNANLKIIDNRSKKIILNTRPFN